MNSAYKFYIKKRQGEEQDAQKNPLKKRIRRKRRNEMK